jgi:hypothetical protein
LRNNETEGLGIGLLLYQQCSAHIKFCGVHVEVAVTSEVDPGSAASHIGVFSQQCMLLKRICAYVPSLRKKPHIV